MFKNTEEITEYFVKNGWAADTFFEEVTLTEAQDKGLLSVINGINKGQKFFKMSNGNIYNNAGECILFNTLTACNSNKKMVHGFKVFNSDWICDQLEYNSKRYTCPGRFEEEKELDIFSNGMYFFENIPDCFYYYDFDSKNKVAEVIAYGEVIVDDGVLYTDKLEIVREVPWDEVLKIINHGKDCIGICNSGNYNNGDYNSGFSNNGNYNSGNCNSGSANSGSWNSGSWNSGHWNNGICNSGICNSGNYNSGSWNKTNFSNGCFNTEEPPIFLFNKPSNMTYQQWLNSDANHLLDQITRDVVRWVYKEQMTDEEKSAHPFYKTTGGYLKVVDKSEGRQSWWNDLPENEKEIIKSIPNFDADIFYKCTGIKVQ